MAYPALPQNNSLCLMKLQLQNMRGFNMENYLQHLIFEGRILMLCFDINTISDSKINACCI